MDSSAFAQIHMPQTLSTMPLTILSRFMTLPYLLALIVLATLLAVPVYRLFFHPLARFPGPKFAAIAEYNYAFSLRSGKMHEHVQNLHRKYGKIVRVAPNKLSIATADSWKEVYGFNPTKPRFLKGSFYRAFGRRTSLFTETDPVIHGKMRKLLSHAFSPEAILQHEGIVHEHVKKFIGKLRGISEKRKPFEMSTWFHFLAFDIIGDLAFGEPFGSLDSGKPHPWASQAALAFYWAGLVDLFQWSGLFVFISWVSPKILKLAGKQHAEHSKMNVFRRIRKPSKRTDIMTSVLRKREAYNVTDKELVAHFGAIIAAGGETTATVLSTITHFLLKTPHAMDRLVHEIRSNFNNVDEVTAEATSKLPYLHAAIMEGLRIYPPIALGAPRVSPGALVNNEYIPRGAEIAIPTFTIHHDESNFHRAGEFIPERWLDPSCSDRLSASQPFLLGPHSCLGKNLALLELRLVLTMLLLTFDIEAAGKKVDWLEESQNFVLWRKPKFDVFLRPVDTRACTELLL